MVARDGFVSWEGSRYGVHWQWVGATVQVGQRLGTVEIWDGDQRLAVHPRSQKAGQRFTMPGQWDCRRAAHSESAASLQRVGPAAPTGLGVEGTDAHLQTLPRNQSVHPFQEQLPVGLALLALEFQFGKCRLVHHNLPPTGVGLSSSTMPHCRRLVQKVLRKHHRTQTSECALLSNLIVPPCRRRC